jgi:AcrR family transcriptional regulator
LIAEEVGLSQPALFNHFASRDAILAAVVARSRDQLRQAAERVLADGADWATTVAGLGDAMIAHIGEQPGLARLLFHELTARGDKPMHASLAGLVDMQAGLVASLVRDAQSAQDVPDTVDADAAGRLFVAAMQGAILHFMLGSQPGASPPAGLMVRQAVRMWVAGVRAGVPQGSPAVPGPTPEPLVSLDVRPHLARGEEPLDVILQAVARIGDDGVLLLTAPFRPGPLLIMLGRRGFAVEASEVASMHWEVEVCGPECPAVLDLRDLEAPEPMEAVLLATGPLEAGAVVVARVPRVPRLLLPHLEDRGLEWRVHERADGTALVYIRRPG